MPDDWDNPRPPANAFGVDLDVGKLPLRVLGVDPGVDGALALYLHGATVPTVPDGIRDLPIVDGELNCAQLRDVMWELKPHLVAIELLSGWSPPGVKISGHTLFKMGGAYYSIQAVAACLNI